MTSYDGSGRFETSDDAFYTLVDSGEVYGDDISTLYRENGGDWLETDSVYDNVWEALYMDDCKKMPDVISDGVEYYHLTATQDAPFNAVAELGALHGFTDIINGDLAYDIYLSKVSEDIIRIDLEMPFRGTIEGESKKGTLKATFVPSGTSGVSIEKPEAAEIDTYETGEVSVTSNKFQNKVFDIQILGGDIFVYDLENTTSLTESYKANNSGYREEAYGSAAGVIVNISSIKAEENTKENVMAKYLQDCVASNIMNMGTMTIGSSEYATATSEINGTKTKTYCTMTDGRALLITIYCNESSTIAAFEDNMYSISENPFWQEESWTLEGKYEISTPKGYSVVKEESSNLYVCMRSSSDSVDIFAIENGTIESETAKETQSVGSEVKELVSSQDVETSTNGTMKYMVVHCTDSGLDYYTYIGRIQKETAVIKLYSVSSAGDKDYSYTYLKFSDKIKDSSEAEAYEQIICETLAMKIC